MASRSWGSRNRCLARCWARSTIAWGVSSSGLASVKSSLSRWTSGPDLQTSAHRLPPPQPLPPNLPLTPFSTCQASDEVLLWVPQEAGAAQSSFQPLPTLKDRLQRGRWLRREAEPSLPLQGTHKGPI